MKRLYIIRHAKSSWDDPGLNDFERPINRRGERDAPVMGKRLKKNGVMPDIIISSPAMRAFETAKIIAGVIGYPEKSIKKEKEIYEADADALLHILHSLKNSLRAVMIFGHNPGMSDLAENLCSFDFGNLPTCGIICIDFPATSWNMISKKNGSLVFFDYPKKHK